ncbi:hypothetical protein [Halopseudomonas sp.]|uniref:hypothetical protein n=1 Tax=Halopseudomonas sp. TaxID=2901191 RepID=UPI0030035BBD
MLTATTFNSSSKRFLSAVNLSLLVLVLLFLSVMVQQKALGPSPAEGGFVGKVEQIVAASYAGSLKLHKDPSPKDDNPEPNPSLHWGLASHVGLFPLAPRQTVTSSYSQRYTPSPASAYRSPPLRAPPSA